MIHLCPLWTCPVIQSTSGAGHLKGCCEWPVNTHKRHSEFRSDRQNARARLTNSIKLDEVENPVTKRAAKCLMDSYGQEAVNPLSWEAIKRRHAVKVEKNTRSNDLSRCSVSITLFNGWCASQPYNRDRLCAIHSWVLYIVLLCRHSYFCN